MLWDGLVRERLGSLADGDGAAVVRVLRVACWACRERGWAERGAENASMRSFEPLTGRNARFFYVRMSLLKQLRLICREKMAGFVVQDSAALLRFLRGPLRYAGTCWRKDLSEFCGLSENERRRFLGCLEWFRLRCATP